jgi:NAD(P)-dependent dehydrogenase (short-subunit alcohol dehydrogenase family)
MRGGGIGDIDVNLEGKRVLAVGGTSGIGAGVARLAIAAGAEVTTASRRHDDSPTGLADRHLVLDIADETQVRACLMEQSPFDHLVVTAGGAKPGKFREQGTDAAAQAFETKFWGAWRVAALAPLVPDASITFVSGVFAERPAAGQVAASCVNAALEALARALAVELGPIRVNAVSPGLVDTPMWHGMPEERRSAYFASVAEKLPARRICSDDDVAALVLACMTNPVLTGSVLKIDGGYTLV